MGGRQGIFGDRSTGSNSPYAVTALLGKPECAIRSELDPNGLTVGMGKGVLSDVSVKLDTTDLVPRPFRKPKRPVWPCSNAERQTVGGWNDVLGDGLCQRRRSCQAQQPRR